MYVTSNAARPKSLQLLSYYWSSLRQSKLSLSIQECANDVIFERERPCRVAMHKVEHTAYVKVTPLSLGGGGGGGSLDWRSLLQ